jgi:sugar phosphate isomerase/epimerase
VESFIQLGAELKLDVLDIRTDKGWGSAAGDTSGGKSSDVTQGYLAGVKLLALQRGLSIGYLASIGHFTGTTEQNAALVAAAKEDVDTAVLMGAPLLRCFTSCSGDDYGPEVQAREVACFQEICDFAATRGIAVGCQNHPSTGAHMMRIREAVNRPNFTFVLDTGQCAPYAAHVRAKFFAVESGKESWLDYSRIVRILDAAGFNGTLGIVFEGGAVNKGLSDREVFATCAAELRELTARRNLAAKI